MYNFRHKKITSVLILIVMVVALAGCGESAKIPDKYNYDDLSQYIKLGDYEGLTYKKPKIEVSDAEVKAKIDSNLDAAATETEVKDGVATETSVLNVDYAGKVDGKAFEGGTAEGQKVDIANSQFIDGFAEGMVGHKVGETFDINVTFPENYGSEELAGKDAVFTITINSMTERVVPEFDDEFVKANSDFKTTKEYSDDIKATLLADKEKQSEQQTKQELFSKIVEGSNITEYPEAELKDAKDMMISTYKDAASANGMSYEDYVKNQIGMSTEDFEKQMVQVSAENMVKQELVVRCLADKLGLKFTDKDYDDFLMGLLDDVNMSKDDFKTNYGTTIYEYADQQNLYGSMLYEKVMEEIIKISVAK